ncbi:MAG: CARDB domain-containing protein [Armatimonadota bacterium]
MGTPNYTVYPRSRIKGYQIQRDEAWDKHPNLSDLTVTFIEINPKLAGLHGRVDYDKWGRPILKGGPILDLGEETAMRPEDAVKKLKLKYTPSEQITMTAHVKNVGFATAKPFSYTWSIDGKQVASGEFKRSLKEMEETTFSLKWNWEEGFHSVTFAIKTDQPQIATINDSATDPLWAFPFTFTVAKGRVNAWHKNRTAYGTFSFEDFYRWHLDIMNKLFEASKFPSAPDGIKARVRLDRIVYAEDVEKAIASLVAPDGIRYDQGGWNWIDDQDRNKNWQPPSKEWRNQTEWSLPHELGHQLGLTDWYVLDYGGDENHVWPDTGEKVTHFQNHPIQMMHWHGPHLFGEVDAGYLNMTWDKPRGHFGDYYFAIPRNNYLRIVDVNGLGVPKAKVEIYQRGCMVDKNAQPGEDQGVKYYSAVEDGNFDLPLSKEPVIVGETDENGVMRLPNRPVKEVRTLNGFHRQPNPFGNINVLGQRGELLVKVSKYDRPVYFWLEIYDFNVAWFRGQKDHFTIVLKTPYRSVSSPLSPQSVKAEKIDENHVRITWSAPQIIREQQYLDRVIGYRVYRRIGSDCLNDRPWFTIATLGPDAREFVVDLSHYPDDINWFSKTNRFAVSSLGELSMESELVETVLPQTAK